MPAFASIDGKKSLGDGEPRKHRRNKGAPLNTWRSITPEGAEHAENNGGGMGVFEATPAAGSVCYVRRRAGAEKNVLIWRWQVGSSLLSHPFHSPF